MYRLGFVLLVGLLMGCNNKKASGKEGEESSYAGFSNLFKATSLPYQVTEEDLKKATDTVQIRSEEFSGRIPDTLVTPILGDPKKVKYLPVARIESKNAETYYIVKATNSSRQAYLLTTYNKDRSYGATIPLLVPDGDGNTTQTALIDKNYNIFRNVVRKKGSEVVGEGKDVFVYNAAARQFTLIQTDVLDERSAELINPIDTLPGTHRFAGDYYLKEKRNIVSIRDARSPTQAMAFVHLDKNNGECVGELKGEILFTSTSTAVYRQGGDPCVLQFTFSGNTVTLKEEQGCGNHRGLNCPLEGVYTRKKEVKPKAPVKKGSKK